MPAPPNPPGYVEVPRNYAERPAIQPYSVGWQYTDPLPPPPMSSNAPSNKATAGSAPSSRSASGDILEAKSRERWHGYYYEYEYPGPPVPVDPPSAPEPAQQPAQTAPKIPVLLCHTCSTCGRMRSAAYHRANPVIPNQQVVQGVCRRCKKKAKKEEEARCVRKVTHIRTCTADEPCDWPERNIHIQIGSEYRGRPRSRSFDRHEVYVSSRRSTSPPRVIKRGESQHRVGLRVLQEERSPPRMLRRKSGVRYASASPPRESVRFRDTVDIRNSGSRPPPLECAAPPPREDPIPRPPVQYRARSISPLRYRSREEYYSRDAMKRMASHPLPYRSVLPDQRAFIRESSEEFARPPSPARIPRQAQSPSRSILKPAGMQRETSYRRRSMHGSQESTKVEVGGPRVQFVQDPARAPPKPLPESSGNERYRVMSRRDKFDDPPSGSEDYDHYYRRAGAVTQYLDEPSPPRRATSPPIRAFEEFRVRHVSPPPRGSSAGRSNTPHPRSLSQERVSIGYRTSRPGPSPPEEQVYIRYRNHYPALPERESSPPVLQPKEKEKEKDWEEVTASDSEDSAEVVNIRSWRGIDENRQPATFIEERTTRYVSEHDRLEDERHRTMTPGNWKDV